MLLDIDSLGHHPKDITPYVDSAHTFDVGQWMPFEETTSAEKEYPTKTWISEISEN